MRKHPPAKFFETGKMWLSGPVSIIHLNYAKVCKIAKPASMLMAVPKLSG